MRKTLLIIVLSFSLTGCMSFGKKLKAFLGGNKGEVSKAQQQTRRGGPKFSENPNLIRGTKRNYKRTTKRDLERGAQLDSNAGSLWVMEGQGAYLFSQNIMRMIGDPIAVRINGDSKDQLQAKTKVISKLLKKIEARRAALRRPAKVIEKAAKKELGIAEKSEEKKSGDSKNKELGSDPDFNVKSVPTRIVERLVDGNYRIKGSQPFLIGQKEYKTIVTGIVRAEDFSEEGISSDKLIDPRFDIVSVRKRGL